MLHHGTNTTLPISRGKIDLLSASASLASVCLQRETTIRILNLQKKTHGNKIPGSYPLQSSVLLIIFSRKHVYTITKFCGKIRISDSLSDYSEMEHIQRILLWKCIILFI